MTQTVFLRIRLASRVRSSINHRLRARVQHVDVTVRDDVFAVFVKLLRLTRRVTVTAHVTDNLYRRTNCDLHTDGEVRHREIPEKVNGCSNYCLTGARNK